MSSSLIMSAMPIQCTNIVFPLLCTTIHVHYYPAAAYEESGVKQSVLSVSQSVSHQKNFEIHPVHTVYGFKNIPKVTINCGY